MFKLEEDYAAGYAAEAYDAEKAGGDAFVIPQAKIVGADSKPTAGGSSPGDATAPGKLGGDMFPGGPKRGSHVSVVPSEIPGAVPGEE